MAYNDKHDDRAERITNQLADSVLGLPDEEILAEVREAGADPDEEGERVRAVLCDASLRLENVSRYLSNLGHTVPSGSWRYGRWGYQTVCLNCGSVVNLKTASTEMQVPCPAAGLHGLSRREASGK